MAIAHSHILFLTELKKQGVFNELNAASMLELGEQNWYGDVSPLEIGYLIDEFAPEKQELKQTLNDLIASLSQAPRYTVFDIARVFYQLIFDYATYRAIDLHGSPVAEKYDLNQPLPFTEQYDVVTNLGTAEHIFNLLQFFRTIHEKTKPGGFMLHSLPNQGCYDHGFFNFHPTFVFDLCQANQYHLMVMMLGDAAVKPNTLTQIVTREDYVKMAVEGKLSNQSGLVCILRKAQTESEFIIPQQGYYDNRLSPELRQAWENLPK